MEKKVIIILVKRYYKLVLLLIIALISGFNFLAGHKSGTTTFNNSLPELERTFEKMKVEARWDINKPLIWGYYFYDHDDKKPELFAKKLQKEGFKISDFRRSADIKDNLFVLYITERKIHTPKSLFDRCNKLKKLANENNIEIFDGWEAGQDEQT